MLIQGQLSNAVPTARQPAGSSILQLPLGEAGVSEILPRYAALTWSGQVFSVSVPAAAAITAYSGGAGGTPQIAVWNPPGSGHNLAILLANYANVVAASAAGTVTWGLYYGPTANITGTASATYPINQLSLQSTGSVAKAYVNAALTSSTALTNVVPLGAYYWATAAGAVAASQASPVDFAGAILIPPGAMAALGGSAALTSATWQGNLIWAELPV
jgi:hypothetical protein